MNQINDLEHKEAKKPPKKPNQSKQEEKKIRINEDTVSSLWDNFKHSNIHVVGVPVGEEKEQEIENRFKK